MVSLTFAALFNYKKNKTAALGFIHQYGYKLIPIYLAITTLICVVLYFLAVPFLDYAVLSSYFTDTPRYLSIYDNEQFNVINLLSGFLLIFLIGLQFCLLIGGILAINLSEFSNIKLIAQSRNIVELFNNIPSVVYGYILLLIINEWVDFTNTFSSIISSGLILSVMMLPMVIYQFINILQSIPYDQREGAYSLGATRYKTAFMVLIPSQIKLFAAAVVTIGIRTFCEILILLLVTSIFVEKIEVIIFIFAMAIIGTWISQLLKKSHYNNGAI